MALSMHVWKKSSRRRYEQGVLACTKKDTETLAAYVSRFCENAEGLGWSQEELFKVLRDNTTGPVKTVLLTIQGAEYMTQFELLARIEDFGIVEGDMPQMGRMGRIEEDSAGAEKPAMIPHPTPSRTGPQEPPPYKRTPAASEHAPTKDEVLKDPSKKWCDAHATSAHIFLDCPMFIDDVQRMAPANQEALARGVAYYQAMRSVRSEAYKRIRDEQRGGKKSEGTFVKPPPKSRPYSDKRSN